jgi:hypothetical protein
MNQIRPIASFDLNTGGLAELLRTLPDRVAHWLGKARAVENADATREQKAGYPARETRSRQSTGDDDPVVGRQHTLQIHRVPIRHCRFSDGHSPHHRCGGNRIACFVPALPA